MAKSSRQRRLQRARGVKRPSFVRQDESSYQPPPEHGEILEETPEERQADVVNRLRKPGLQRARLAAELEQVDDLVRPLVIEAVQAGIPYRRVSELAGISRATVARWAKGSGGAA